MILENSARNGRKQNSTREVRLNFASIIKTCFHQFRPPKHQL